MAEVILQEKYGKQGPEIKYVESSDKSTLNRLYPSNFASKTVEHKVKNVFRDAFLPQGYPESVSKDYFDYQIWDTAQAFCSTIMGTLTAQAILTGIGVGDASATPYAAAVAWILKDGTGMLGRIIFAWWKGVSLDMDCKKWRLFADFLNDLAMLIELTLPYFAHFSTLLLCLTTSMKALVGVAGGATRASITQHQAVRGNMADVSAKDGSQETFVNLCSSFMGIFLLTAFDDPNYHWMFFVLLTFMHLYSNHRAVKSLVLHTLNTSRLILIINQYLSTKETLIDPTKINKQESVLLGFGVSAKSCYGFDIKLGCSLSNVPKKTFLSEDLHKLTKTYENEKYLILASKPDKTIYVVLEDEVSSNDVVSAYYQSVLLGISIFDVSTINFKSIVISDAKKKFYNGDIQTFNSYIAEDVEQFISTLKENGWNTDNHLLEVDEWRAKWKKTE